MRVQSTSSSTLSGAARHGTGRLIFAATGGAAVVGALLIAGTWTYRGGDSPTATDSPAVVVAPAVFEAASVRPASANSRGQTVYIVGSDQQAASVVAGINEANVVRAATNELPSWDSVVVVASDAQAAEVMNAVAEGNRILAVLGEPEKSVVDLRGG